jgi:hypothetical protein
MLRKLARATAACDRFNLKCISPQGGGRSRSSPHFFRAIRPPMLRGRLSVLSPAFDFHRAEAAANRLITSRVQPMCPRDACSLCVNAAVRLTLLVNSSGTVRSITVLGGDLGLAEPVLDAVRQWRYEPYRLYGSPVAVLETNLPGTERRRPDVGNITSGASPIESRTTGTQEGFPRCRTSGEATRRR